MNCRISLLLCLLLLVGCAKPSESLIMQVDDYRKTHTLTMEQREMVRELNEELERQKNRFPLFRDYGVSDKIAQDILTHHAHEAPCRS